MVSRRSTGRPLRWRKAIKLAAGKRRALLLKTFETVLEKMGRRIIRESIAQGAILVITGYYVNRHAITEDAPSREG